MQIENSQDFLCALASQRLNSTRCGSVHFNFIVVYSLSFVVGNLNQ
jgi:hypothetical protein